MRIQTAAALTIFLLLVPALEAQRRGGGGGGGGRGGMGGGRPSGPPPSVGRPSPGGGQFRGGVQRPLPSTPIAPMTNPIAPMTNPIGPVVPYGGAGRVLNNPSQLPVRRGDNIPSRIERRRDRIDRVNAPVVFGAPYWSPYFGPYVWDYMYYNPYLQPPTIPGQLPGVYPVPQDPASYVDEPAPAPVQEVAPAEPEVIYYPEPQMIIDLPEPAREPPAIGTSRADVLARYGQPWGSLVVRGRETIYLRGGVQVVLENDRVIQVR